MGIETSRRYHPAKNKKKRDKNNYNKYIYKGLA